MSNPKQQCQNYYPTDFDQETLTEQCSECGTPIEQDKYYCSESCLIASNR